jgi:hypothetical protein
LRGAGRKAEADRLAAIAIARAGSIPDAGFGRMFRKFVIMSSALYSGQRERALEMLEQFGRESPEQLLQIPAMSLRWIPAYRQLAGDPRFEAVDERVRVTLNGERGKAGLAPISHDAWISNARTLLTKN